MQDNLDSRVATRVGKARLFDQKDGKPPKVSDVPMIKVLKFFAVLSFIVAIVPLVFLVTGFEVSYLIYAFMMALFGIVLLGLSITLEFLYAIMLNAAKQSTKETKK